MPIGFALLGFPVWRRARAYQPQAAAARRCCGAPSMGTTLEVKVPPKTGHRDRSEAQLRKGDRPWEGSVERRRGPTDRNRIQAGNTRRGERAVNREASMTKSGTRRSGGRAPKGSVLTWGDLACA